MQVTVIADKSVFDDAIAAADRVGQTNAVIKGLNAPVDGTLGGWISEAWDALRHGLEQAYALGRQAAQGALDNARQTIERVLQDASKRATEVSVALRDKLREYISSFLDGMLRQVRPALSIGDSTLRLTEIQLAQKVVLGGSLKASIDEAIALTADSELTIEATYRAG